MSTENKFARLRSGLAGMILNRGGLFIANFLTSIILARSLGPAGRGEYGIYITTLSMLVIILNFGLAAANTVVAGRNPAAFHQLTANAIIFSVFISIPVFLISKTIESDTLMTFSQMSSFYWMLASLNLPLNIILLLLGGILLGQQDYNAYNRINLFQGALNLIGAIIALVVLKSGVPGLIIANGLIGAFIVVIFMVILFIRKSNGNLLLFTPNWQLFRETLPVGFRATLVSVLENLHFKIDLLLLGLWIGKEAVGIYSLSVYISGILMFLPPILNSMVFSYIPSNGVSSAKFIVQISYMVMIIPLAGVLAAVLIGKPLIAFIYTPQFLPSYLPLLVLLVSEIPKAQVAITAGFLAGIGYPLICVIGAVAGLLINLLMNFLLIPSLSGVGAAISSVVSYTVFAAIYLGGVVYYGNLTIADLRPSPALMRDIVKRFFVSKKSLESAG